MGLNLEEIYGQPIIEDQIPNEYSEYNPKHGYGWAKTLPARQGLYNPEYEKDACGVGFAAYVSLPYFFIFILFFIFFGMLMKC